MNDAEKAVALLRGKFCENCDNCHETTNFGRNISSFKWDGIECIEEIYMCRRTKTSTDKYNICDSWKENPFHIDFRIDLGK